MAGTPVSLPPGLVMPGTSVQLAPGGLIEGSVPNSVTVQILSDPSSIQTTNSTNQDVNVFSLSEPGGSMADNQVSQGPEVIKPFCILN